MKLLHLIASPRGEKSRTLHIAHEFLQSLKMQYPDLEVESLDLFKVELPELVGNMVDVKYMLLSGATLDEQSQHNWDSISAYAKAFLDFDAYLISAPMWNFTVPYRLKHYIDIIMQPGVLFRFTENGVEGLARNKKMYCITSRGSDYGKDSPMHQLDFQEPYLRAIFGMAGIHDINFINAQPMDYTPELTQLQLERAKSEARSMALSSVL